MNYRQRNDKKGKKGSSVAALILIGIWVLAEIGEAVGGGLIFAAVIVIAVIAVIASALKKAKSRADEQPSRKAEPAARREFVPESFDLQKSVKNAKSSISKRLTEEMRDDISECGDDHFHEPGFRASPEEKRAQQLKDFLRNGLIEREEYDILMRKYGLK